MQTVLHLTQTNINSDSRILKEIAALKKVGKKVFSIGVFMNDQAPSNSKESDIESIVISLLSRKLTFLPRILIQTFSTVELILKMLPIALRFKPDVIHCHDTMVLPVGVFVKLFRGAKIIYDAHELESNRNGLNVIGRELTYLVEKIFWRYVNALIVVSPSIDVWYQKNIGHKYSTVVLNSPIFEDKTLYDCNYLKQKFSISSDKKIFIYVGILGPGRGIDLIVKIFTDPEIKSHVVFLGYGIQSNYIKKLATDYPNIHYHGAVNHSDVVPITKSADFGLCLVQNVSLSDYYCLPNKLFEYSFSGIPVLASNFPDIQKIVSTYNIGVCCDLDFDSVKESVIYLENKKEKFIFNDITPLGWEYQEKKLIELYNNIL